MGDSRPACGPSCTKFVYPVCWHFDIDATSKTDDVLTVLLFDFFGGTPPTPTCIKVISVVGGWRLCLWCGSPCLWFGGWVEPVSIVWECGSLCLWCLGWSLCLWCDCVGACVYGNPMILVSAPVPMGLIGSFNWVGPRGFVD